MTVRVSRYSVLAGLILCLALALRLAAAWWWQARMPDSRFAFGDSESYWILAEQIATGQPYQYGVGASRAFRTPGYPILLSSLFLVSQEPPVMWARALGSALGTVTVGAIICLTRRLFSTSTSLLAGVLAALYPGAVGMSIFVLSEALFCPLMVWQLIAWTDACQSPCLKRASVCAALAGFAAGLATLTRPSWLLFTPLALCLALILSGSKRRQLMVGIAMLTAFVATMLPWWIRNYRVTGGLVLTTTQTGASLYDGLNPVADGSSNMQFVDRFDQEQRQADAQSTTPPTGTFEQRLDQRMRDAASRWARDHPRQVIRLAFVKLWRIWSPWPHAAEMQSWTFRLVVMLGYVPLLLCGLAGTVRFAARGWPYLLCALPAVYFTLLHMVFVASIRYRQPAVLVLIVLAAGFLTTSLRLPDRIREWMPGDKHPRNIIGC